MLAWSAFPKMANLLRYRRLQWLGHVARMSDDRLPKQMLFGTLEGQSAPGRPVKPAHRVKSAVCTAGVQAPKDSWASYMLTYMAAIREKYYSSEPKDVMPRKGQGLARKVVPSSIDSSVLDRVHVSA